MPLTQPFNSPSAALSAASSNIAPGVASGASPSASPDAAPGAAPDNAFGQNPSSTSANNLATPNDPNCSNNFKKNSAPSLIWLSVAELSGDMHAADLAGCLKGLIPNLKLRGIAGPSLRGLNSSPNQNIASSHSASLSVFTELYGIEQLSVMGGTEVLSALPRILKILAGIKKDMQANRPDAVVLVDAPDFNFRVAKIAHKLEIPVYYYISPKIWAWRSSRAWFLKKFVRKVLCILPFEQEFYAKFGIDAPYVGNPLVAAMNLPELDKIEPVAGRIGLMPGSRKKEVNALMPLFAQAAKLILQAQPGVSFHCIQAPGISQEMLHKFWPSDIPLHLEPPQERYAFMRTCQCILAASGTATLECALVGTPTVVTYRLSSLSAFLLRKIIQVKYVSLPNLILNQEIFPELLQENAKPELMALHILNWLQENNSKQKVKCGLAQIRNLLGTKSAPAEASLIILQDYQKTIKG